MDHPLQVILEIGPKGKKVAAVAIDWPGLARGDKTAETALERLTAYLPRYAPIAQLAGMAESFAALSAVKVVEEYVGTGSTDFWGISFAFSSFDRQTISTEALERELILMQASWMFFDQVRSRVSADLQKGPRGGGRDRDHIVRHTLAAEQDWATKLGVRILDNANFTDEMLTAHRAAFCDAIRAFHAENKLARTWPLRYLIRHTAYHTLDHAWEMEDKDLTNA